MNLFGDESSTAALSLDLRDSVVTNLNQSTQNCHHDEDNSKSDTSSIFSKINDNSPKESNEL